MAANFQNMAAAGGNPMMMQSQAAQNPNQQLQQMLFQNIAQQSILLSGWQAAVDHRERFNQVWHM
jgi:hypothetical protein